MSAAAAPGGDAAQQPAPAVMADGGRVVRFLLRLGVALLSSGAQTTEVEDTVRRVGVALGAAGVEVVVTYSTVTVSFLAEGDQEATTALQLVREWRTDFSRLAALSGLARRIEAGGVGLDDGQQQLGSIVAVEQPYGRLLAFAAPGLSAAAATILFGGSPADAAVTLAIALGIQPVLAWFAGGRLPPFFLTLVGVLATAFVVVLLVALGLPVDGGLVLSGSLLRFLPGNGLVTGMRDLIDGSTVSGTAGLAEAVLLAGAVAGGAALAIAVGADHGAVLSLSTDGGAGWPIAVLLGAAALAVVFYAIQLGVPAWALPGAAALGALATAIARGWVPVLSEGLVVVAAFAVGLLGRFIARRTRSPVAIWTVPAILPLLPGLAIVSAMLAPTTTLRIAGLFDALVIGFGIGLGVGMGDVVGDTARRVRTSLLDPAVSAVAGGLGELIVTPARQRHTVPPADPPDPDPDPAALHQPPPSASTRSPS